MSEASDIFNALSYEIRTQVIPDIIETQINQLNMERERLTKHYRAHIREIDAHLINLHHSLEIKLEQIRG